AGLVDPFHDHSAMDLAPEIDVGRLGEEAESQLALAGHGSGFRRSKRQLCRFRPPAEAPTPAGPAAFRTIGAAITLPGPRATRRPAATNPSRRYAGIANFEAFSVNRPVRARRRQSAMALWSNARATP